MAEDPIDLARFIQARGEKLEEAKRAFQQSHESLLKTKKKLNDSLIEQKRAEAAFEEIRSSQSCTRTFVQSGRVFIHVDKQKLTEELATTVESNQQLRQQFGELEKKMESRALSTKAAYEQIQHELIKQYEAQRA